MVMQNNVPIGRMEFVDPKSIYVINNYSGKWAQDIFGHAFAGIHGPFKPFLN